MARALFSMMVFLSAACSPSGGMSRTDDGTLSQGLIGIFVTPEEAMMPLGGSLQLKATGLYDDKSTADLTATVTWHLSKESVAAGGNTLDAEGRVEALSVGGTDVWATLDGVESSKIRLTVTDQSIEALSVEPDSVVLELGQEVELAATATYSDGTRADATGLVRWVTDDGSVATLSGGTLTAAGTGATSISAKFEDISSTPVSVEVLAQAAPDLRISTLTATPYGDQLTVVVQIENIGNSGASAFWVDAFLDPAFNPGPGDFGDVYERVAWVGPGETVQAVLEIAGVADGDHDLVVVADTEDEIDEDNENNNVAETPVSVFAPGGGTEPTDPGGTPTLSDPDLSVDRVDFLSDGYWVYYEVEISNYGDLGAGPFYVDLFADEWSSPSMGSDGDDWVEVAWLSGWDTVVVEFMVEIDCYYGCDSWVVVDSYEDVSESYEADNIYGPVYVY